MNDFCAVRGQRDTLLPMLLSEHLEYIGELLQGCPAGRHQGITSRNSRQFGDPGTVLLAVKHRLVIVQFHAPVLLMKSTLRGSLQHPPDFLHAPFRNRAGTAGHQRRDSICEGGAAAHLPALRHAVDQRSCEGIARTYRIRYRNFEPPRYREAAVVIDGAAALAERDANGAALVLIAPALAEMPDRRLLAVSPKRSV